MLPKVSHLLPISLLLLLSCSEHERVVSLPEPQSFKEHTVFTVNELINPEMMTFCHDKLVLVNGTKGKKDLLYFYNPTDMSLSFSALKLGNGNHEVVDMNPAFLAETPDGFLLNTRNWMGISAFKMNDSGIEKIDEYSVAPEPMNHLQRMEDGSLVYKALSSSQPFTRVKEKGSEPVAFGDFPKPPFTIEKTSDLFNFYQYSITPSHNGNMMVFYQLDPKLQIYHGDRLVSEVVYEAEPQKVSSMDEFYDETNVRLYFLLPKRAGKHQYVVYVNKTIEELADDMSMQLLRVDERGDVLSSWKIEEMSLIFAVSPDERYFYTYKETEEAGEIHRFRLD